jgi:hypothetical protein
MLDPTFDDVLKDSTLYCYRDKLYPRQNGLPTAVRLECYNWFLVQTILEIVYGECHSEDKERAGHCEAKLSTKDFIEGIMLCGYHYKILKDLVPIRDVEYGYES